MSTATRLAPVDSKGVQRKRDKAWDLWRTRRKATQTRKNRYAEKRTAEEQDVSSRLSLGAVKRGRKIKKPGGDLAQKRGFTGGCIHVGEKWGV